MVTVVTSECPLRRESRLDSAVIPAASARCGHGTEAAARVVTAMKLLSSLSQVPTRTLFLSRDGRFFSISGQARIDLGTKGPLRRILGALAKAHREGAWRGLSVDEVFKAGWPRETASRDERAGRVYTAISTLRRLMLEKLVIGTYAVGYRLDRRCCVIEEGPIRVGQEPATEVRGAA